MTTLDTILVHFLHYLLHILEILSIRTLWWYFMGLCLILNIYRLWLKTRRFYQILWLVLIVRRLVPEVSAPECESFTMKTPVSQQQSDELKHTIISSAWVWCRSALLENMYNYYYYKIHLTLWLWITETWDEINININTFVISKGSEAKRELIHQSELGTSRIPS